jgi:hypothetical protein
MEEISNSDLEIVSPKACTYQPSSQISQSNGKIDQIDLTGLSPILDDSLNNNFITTQKVVDERKIEYHSTPPMLPDDRLLISSPFEESQCFNDYIEVSQDISDSKLLVNSKVLADSLVAIDTVEDIESDSCSTFSLESADIQTNDVITYSLLTGHKNQSKLEIEYTIDQDQELTDYFDDTLEQNNFIQQLDHTILTSSQKQESSYKPSLFRDMKKSKPNQTCSNKPAYQEMSTDELNVL